MFPQASVEAIDFLNKTLVSPRNRSNILYCGLRFERNRPCCQTFDAKKRMTADEALAHPYLSSYVRVSSFFNCRRALNPRLKA
jgi:hypothetical protein